MGPEPEKGEVPVSDGINRQQENPYIEVKVTTTRLEYNPEYGDDRVCKCGHTYNRHFDSYEDMSPCGCKYCNCDEFEEGF